MATGQSAKEAAASVRLDAITGSDTTGRVGNKFDPYEAQAALTVSAAFAASAQPLAGKLVGDVGEMKRKEAELEAVAYVDLAKAATLSGDTAVYVADSRRGQPLTTDRAHRQYERLGRGPTVGNG